MSTTLTIGDLPAPPPGRTGWPWTVGCDPMSETTPDGRAWPKVTVVTPSYNQGRFIEETIRSVLLQGYPNLEYLVLDGGSRDETVDVLRKYDRLITHWQSAKDKGQSDAINRGLDRATGDWVGWQNSDDCYDAGALRALGEATARTEPRPPEGGVDVVYGKVRLIDAESRETGTYPTGEFDLRSMLPWANMFNQSMFFSRAVVAEGWRLDAGMCHYIDHDLFWRLILAGKRFAHVRGISAAFRLHGEAKGFTQHEVAARELHALYMRLYHEAKLPADIRWLALKSMRGNCLDQFGKSRWDLFQTFAGEIVREAGWRGLGLGLSTRRVFTAIGPRNIDRVRKLTRLLRRRGAA
ncbi:MAG TPA: glycosyltransferase family 2 protein [Tepidisphaeraceae bacterium]|nr:glycosyltransferase family 2 protein [Tepidisphaeraceae bacterium]